MEALAYWLVGIVAALVCGWLLSYDPEVAILFKIVRWVAFMGSIMLMSIASGINHPAVSVLAAIAITMAVMIGVVAIAVAATLIHIAEEEKAVYLLAIMLLILGLVTTYPGNVFALLSLAAH